MSNTLIELNILFFYSSRQCTNFYRIIETKDGSFIQNYSTPEMMPSVGAHLCGLQSDPGDLPGLYLREGV